MRTSAMWRLAIMAGLLVCLMIPLQMVSGVISERTERRNSAQAEIGESWGRGQTVGGPMLTIPYEYTYADHNGKPQTAVRRVHFLPESLDVAGTVQPELRYRGLFEVVVYKVHLTIGGQFAAPTFSELRYRPTRVRWEDAALSLGVSDPRGITRSVTLNWNGQEESVAPGVAEGGLFAAGVQAHARGLSQTSGAMPFTFEIDFNGSQQLRFLPTGNETSVGLTSSWPHPSFVGAPLPESRRVDAAGFSAEWRVPYFGRGYPPRWTSDEESNEHRLAQAEASAFGVTLFQPVDIYQQSERAVKYAALFIVMTLVVSFLWEVVRGTLLHPIQYLFVGFAMCLFYLLLLSLSEHIGFDPAYLTAATVTVALLSWYWSRAIGGLMEGALIMTALSALYGFLYLLLRLEDYSLLAGSIGLFVMLALVMYLTRRVNWYDLRLGRNKVEAGL